MATPLAKIIFYLVAAAIVIAQLFILRSTARGMRYAPSVADRESPARAPGPRSPVLEWAYAIVPAVALVALLLFAWRAMHPDTMEVRGVVPGAPETGR